MIYFNIERIDKFSSTNSSSSSFNSVCNSFYVLCIRSDNELKLRFYFWKFSSFNFESLTKYSRKSSLSFKTLISYSSMKPTTSFSSRFVSNVEIINSHLNLFSILVFESFSYFRLIFAENYSLYDFNFISPIFNFSTSFVEYCSSIRREEFILSNKNLSL